MGAYLVKYIEENYIVPSNLTIVEGGTLGFSLMTYYQEYDKIIVLGTGSKEGGVGAISSENAEQVMSNKSGVRKTANEVETTLEELANSGIDLIPNDKNVSFEEIIEGYANPTIADFS